MRPLTPLSPLLLGAEGRTFPPLGGAPSPQHWLLSGCESRVQGERTWPGLGGGWPSSDVPWPPAGRVTLQSRQVPGDQTAVRVTTGGICKMSAEQI